MAIYGRQRSKWDPTRDKAKTSKNRTYEIKRLSGNVHPPLIDQEYTLWLQAPCENNSLRAAQAVKGNGGSLEFDRYDKDADWVIYGDITPQDILDSRFCKAFKFHGLDTSTGMLDRNWFAQNNYLFVKNWSPKELLDMPGKGRNIFISFWVRLDSDSAQSDGHIIGHLVKNPLTDEPTQSLPLMTISTDSSRYVSLRFTEIDLLANIPTVNPGVKYGNLVQPRQANGEPLLISITSDSKLELKKWHFVTFNINLSSGWNETQVEASRIFIDGQEVDASGSRSVTNQAFTKAD